MASIHTCHILPPSETDLGLFLVVLQAWKGNISFTELAERVKYGKYGSGAARAANRQDLHIYVYIYIYIYC